MPSFRSPRAQAKHSVKQASMIGAAKPAGGSSGIHSLGTQRTYTVSLGLLSRWARENSLSTDLRALPEDVVARWLYQRADEVGQKCLDNDRIAVMKGLGFTFPRIPSTHVSARRLAEESRAYSADQIDLVISHQAPWNAFSTELAASAGLRAQELLTLRRPDERPPTAQRDWSEHRFHGLEGNRYTVIGKGGLTREVILPVKLASALEKKRIPRPRSARDRDINYLVTYDLAGGNAWSASFTRASTRALGYSLGAHGLRHEYTQRRLRQLQQAGFSFEAAIAIVSQELGHFRSDVTEIYLR